ncbi:glycoprotein [Streptomyces sp. LP11]|uniref:Glycoprotein n=1 Tax=Streptomyces pyxinicus TaxID=2970331 RepID=A0ABT2B5C9_9ACTN|nr:glycoprotein [Streptomyces sp. LP11]MCS0603732.1 glycoprotein [Streptomyces sp. LP11]
MARTDHEPVADIATALAAAEALTDTYQDYDTGTALHRVGTAAEQPVASRLPLPYPTVHEQAAHDLDLAVSLIVDAPQAHLSLSRLLDSDPIEPEGALVFAALLHLAGYADPAQFWFEFAAGAGSRTAAFCLALLHQQRSEHRTAAYWHSQLRARSRKPARPSHAAPQRAALLPDSVRRDLISLCWQGRRPSLPPRLQAVIHSLPVEPADDDFGEIPRPDHTLIRLPAVTTR